MHDDSAETQRLIDALNNGDREAFDRLFARHRPAIREFVRTRLDTRLRARLDPSDVVQETQAEAFRRITDYLEREPMPFRLWLLKTAYERLQKTHRFHLRAARRTVQREVPLPQRSSLMLARQLSAPNGDRGANPSEHELATRLRSALGRLPPKDREVIVMRDLEGLSNHEIGHLLDVDPATVSKRHGRALIRLHRMLTQLSSGDKRR